MSIVVQLERGVARLPDWARDFASFRRWATSDDYPTRGWFAHLNGELWVDATLERAGHNLLKGEITRVLYTLADRKAGDHFLAGSRMVLTNVSAGLCLEPDGMFFSNAALRDGRVCLANGADSVEVEGGPDMVLEVVSETSLERDTTVLRDVYFRAGVREYWLASPCREDLWLKILRRGRNGLLESRSERGWIKSAVFGMSFRLMQEDGRDGLPDYTLEVREPLSSTHLSRGSPRSR